MKKSLWRRANDKLAKELRLRSLLRMKGREYKKDRNYDLASVEKGFRDQAGPQSDDRAIVERIIGSYIRAKEFQKNAGPAFQVSNEWLPIYERNLKGVIEALTQKDAEKLSRIYKNFMRDQCSTGLHGLPIDMSKHFFDGGISTRNKKRFLCDSLHRYRLWKSLLGDTYTVEDLISPCIGNPYGFFIDGVFVKSGADYLHYYATAISRLIRGSDRRFVAELGGGYGGMAYYLCRDTANLTYMDFDLPENMALAAYYLCSAFPDRKILLFGEAELTAEAIRAHDIILMPSFELKKLPDASIDMIFNSYSLAEMSGETIRAYIDEFMRVCRGYFFHINHNKVSEVVADNFGVDVNKFDLLYKIPALWNAGRDLNMDEYEYLYKRHA